MYQIWDKRNGFNLADGTPCTVEEIHTRYPFTRNGTVIIEKLPNGNVGAIDSLDTIKQVFNVTAEDDVEALEAIEVARNTPPVIEPTAADQQRADIDFLAAMMGVTL